MRSIIPSVDQKISKRNKLEEKEYKTVLRKKILWKLRKKLNLSHFDKLYVHKLVSTLEIRLLKYSGILKYKYHIILASNADLVAIQEKDRT